MFTAMNFSINEHGMHFPFLQFSSVTQSCPTLCDPMNCSTPGLPVHYQLPEFTQTHVHQVGDAIQPSHPLSFPSLPAPNPSQHESFPMSLPMRWPKYWSFSFSIIPSKEIPGLISFRMDWLDLLAVQGTLNTFESVLMRWMKLEPIVQSEVSQKEKHQYSILTHIYGI